jgi:4-carboxymuconolactone decarboxylase
VNVKWVLPPLAVLFLSTGCLDAQATEDSRRSKGEAVITALSGGAGQPVLQAMHADFPFLASATTDFALGEVWGRSELDARTR